MTSPTGLTFTFPVTNLPAGGYVVVVEDPEAFEVRYGTGLPVAGQFTGTLDNGGERIAFATWNGTGSQDFTFDDVGTWPGRADGIGSSLEIIDTAGDYGNSANRRSSCEYNGPPAALGAGGGEGGRTAPAEEAGKPIYDGKEARAKARQRVPARSGRATLARTDAPTTSTTI